MNQLATVELSLKAWKAAAEDLAKQRDALSARCAALELQLAGNAPPDWYEAHRQDAFRYRWLKENHSTLPAYIVEMEPSINWDAAIDAAMKGE